MNILDMLEARFIARSSIRSIELGGNTGTSETAPRALTRLAAEVAGYDILLEGITPGDVVGIDVDGSLLCAGDALDDESAFYNCGESLAEYGLHNLNDAERLRLTAQVAKDLAEALKGITGAADNGEPYTATELVGEFGKYIEAYRQLCGPLDGEDDLREPPIIGMAEG